MLTRTLLIAALLASAGMANAYDVSHEWQDTYAVGSGYTGFTSGLVASSEDSQGVGPYGMISANEIEQRQGYGLDTLEQRV